MTSLKTNTIMKNVILFLTTLMIMFSGKAFTQNIDEIFNKKLTLDAKLSSQTKALDGFMSSYGKVTTKIYKFDGSFEDAVNNMKIPANADVEDVVNQALGYNISMVVMLTENLDPKPMNDDWYNKAQQKVKEFADKNGKSMSMTIYPNDMQNPENIQVGEKMEMRIISVSSPFVDLDNLKIIEGTWVSEVLATTIITEEMMEGESDGFEDDWNEQEIELDVDLPQGVRFVGFDDVADSELLQGDVNYLAEMTTDQAISFFKNNKKRFINSFEQMESASEELGVMTNFYLLEHDGELKSGDDVISVTIMSAPKSILSDALGRNQGTWTLISVSNWTE